MSWAVNDIIQTAAEDLMLTEDGNPVSGDLAAKCEECLNRAITTLNSDGYISLTVDVVDRVAAGSIIFKKLEEGEASDSNIVDSEPPDEVNGVSRKVGIRWMRMRGSNKQMMDRTSTYSYPTTWCYGISTELAPSGKTRLVGTLSLNGTYPAELRIYLNSQMPHYKLGDMMYLSSLYYNLVLAQLKMVLIEKYKLYSYKDGASLDLIAAQKAIDAKTANNRPLDNGLAEGGSYLDGYYDLLGGNGF